MHILQITRSLATTGGIANVASSLARELQRKGAAVENLCWSRAADSEGEAASGSRLPPSFLPRITGAIASTHLRLLLEVPLFTLWSTVAALGARRRGAVLLSHGDTLAADIVVGHSCHWATIGVKHSSGERRWMLYPLHWFILLREALLFRRRRKPFLAAISESVAREYRRYHRFPEERIFLVPNGVDRSRFRPAEEKRAVRRERGLPEDPFLILFAGNEFKRKGLRFAIEGLALCRSAHLPHLLVAGADKPSPYRELARARGVEERVHFLGPVREIEEVQRAADLFLLLSDYEPFGLVAMEALSSGIPVLSTPVGGVKDYLKHELNGLFVERNGEAVARALDRVLEDESLRNRLAANARDSTEAYGWSPIADKYLELCERVLEERRN